MSFIKTKQEPATREAGAGFAGSQRGDIKSPHKNRHVFFALLCVLCVLLFTACGTVIPNTVQANVASYDGGVQNSGLLSMTTNSTGAVTGAIITPHARDRYNALIPVYGTNFFPALKFDEGITPAPPNFRIDAQHLVEFMRMNRWHHQALNPQPLK